MSAQNEINIVATFVAKEGKADELLQAMYALIKPTRQEEGCLRYELHQSVSNPRECTMIEKFESEKALNFHIAQPYFQNFAETTMKEIVENTSIKICKEIIHCS
jgi:quinol monooxygenase YgiN